MHARHTRGKLRTKLTMRVITGCTWAVAAFGIVAFLVQLSSWAAPPLPVENPSRLPSGLTIPVHLEQTLDLATVSVGTTIEARVAQTVPLTERAKIDMKALANGKVLSVTKDSDGTGVAFTVAFVQLEDHDQKFSLTTSLRAIASFESVRAAQEPLTGADGGSPPGWDNTIQIGGDIRYGNAGIVRNQKKQKVGKGVVGGVLVHIQANPNRGCDGPKPGEDFLRATWVFSANACGVYGFKHVNVVHNGSSDPLGQIVLHFDKAESKLERGTALLLEVVEHP